MAEFDFENLTVEQKAAIQEFLYKKYTDQPASDDSQFVVPFIAMNDGHTPAQIKAIAKGLYKDIQRSPFLRKTGTFTAEGKIEDIDITPLVYYGTLQQAKIAPTLENIDVKLYFREPALHKVPSNDPSIGEYADTYIWRELPTGFHVYNNDTVYGYEWIVLQSNYTGTNGIYNLHMNIEDGIGVCKFAGTQAPINLAGVQYKIVITAKNLWNREFSLLDSMPLLHSLTANSDELAPTVNAIKEYYAKAVETLKVVAKELYVADSEDPVLYADQEGVTIKNLTLGAIKNLETFVTTLAEGLISHRNAAVEHAEYDKDGNLLAPHGIKNTGFSGNIAARSLDGLTLSNGFQALTDDIVGNYAYIPYVANDNSIGLGTSVKHYIRGANVNPSLIYSRSFEALPKTETLNIIDISGQDELSNVLYSLSIGTNVFNASLKNIDGKLTLSLNSGNAGKDPVKLEVNSVKTARIDFDDSGEVFIDKAWVQYASNASSIAYKIPISELLTVKVKETVLGAVLVPNRPTDADGFPAETWDTTDLEDHDLKLAAKTFTDDGFNTPEGDRALDKLGSALQAIYELPLSTYEYKRGQHTYKEQIGIFVERVNQFRDHLAELRGQGEEQDGVPSTDNYLVHKRVTSLQSNNAKIIDYNKGLSIADNSVDQGTDFTARVANNEYTYTEEEIKSIAHYLDLMTSKQELQQEVRNTVGILLKAAKETQERLLNVETAVYGFDAETIPGSDNARKSFVDSHIATELQTVLNSSPLLLGLNRLIRAICLELYNTTDLENIDAELRSVVADSDTLKEKITVKSRMDKVDDILSDLTNQASAITRYYAENVLTDECSHTYVDLYDINEEKQTITEEADIVEDEHILDNVEDDHTETKNVDKARTWKNLPSTEDVSKEAKAAVPFASIAESTHKHTPKLDEAGIVRVPETVEFEHKDVDKDGKATTRIWKRWVLEKDEETGTYHPKFKTKGVAWDQAKIERINKKLSEVTKDIYGTDDVTASLPNRTEVLRRNITNLVDDLYPNRSFSVEKKFDVNDAESDIRLPFKTSKLQVPEENVVAAPQTDEPEETEEHTSIITWFDNELFNFKLENNSFIKTFGDPTTRSAFESLRVFELFDEPIGYLKNKQISLQKDEAGARDGTIVFDTSKLVTDEKVFDSENYGTYKKAYSRLDVLDNIIGIKDCYITDLFHPSIDDANSAILDALGITSVTGAVLDLPARQQDLAKVKVHLETLAASISTKIANTTDHIEKLQAQKDTAEPEEVVNIDKEISILENDIERFEKQLNDIQTRITSLGENATGVYDILPSYRDELSFEDLRVTVDTVNANDADKVGESLMNASNLNYVLSRKQKTLQERITTLEAFADEIAKGFRVIDNYRNLDENTVVDLKNSQNFVTNFRFESHDSPDTLQHVAAVISARSSEHLIFDLDLSESYKTDTLDMTIHNADVWKIVKNSKDVVKSAFTNELDDPHYEIRGKLTTDPYYLHFSETKDGSTETPIQDQYYSKWKETYTITVKYVNSLSAAEISEAKSNGTYYKTIYLFRKTPTSNYKYLYNTADTHTADIGKALDGGDGWQNQTEYNIYKTISNMFTSLFTNPKNKDVTDHNSLYYQFMSLAHPVGSIWMAEENSTVDPAVEFGGSWEKIGVAYLSANAAPSTSSGSAITGVSVNNVSAAQPEINISTDTNNYNGYISRVSASQVAHGHTVSLGKSSSNFLTSVSDTKLTAVVVWKRLS